jgi:exopolysaccharide biosynthesis polyprenyl glycosylphosphotransferase
VKARKATATPLDVDSAESAEPRVAWPLTAAEQITRRLDIRRRRAVGLLLVDVALLAFALGASAFGAARAGASVGPLGWQLVYAALTIAVLAGRGGYRFRLRTSPLDHIGQALTGAAVAATLVITARVLTDPSATAASEVVRWWGFTTGYIGAGRVAMSIADARGERRGLATLIVGAGTVGRLVARRLLERPEMGLRPVGFLDKEPKAGEGDLPVLGASWDLEDVVRQHDVSHVVVTFSKAPNEVMLNLVRRCRVLGVEISLVPRLFEEVSNRVTVEHLGGVALLRVDQADPRGWQFEVKYALDRLVGVVLLVLASPLLAVLALAVRVTSPGPILFRQERVGLDGHVFDMLKFRTMRVAAPGVENDAAWAARVLDPEGNAGDEGSAPAAASPDRRTPIGKMLRRWSLDELPQLLNIARGDMSLVGPRPERTGYVRAFEQHVYRYGDRHRVKSGLTGWAQINGLRGDTPLEERIEYDNYYVESWTPWLDLKILLLTPIAVLEGRGAA